MDWRIRTAIAIMRADLTRPLKVTALAARVNLSRSRFTHLFCAETGVGPGRYLRGLRLERAGELLATSSLSIKEVMATVGVNEPEPFRARLPTALRRRSSDLPGACALTGRG